MTEYQIYLDPKLLLQLRKVIVRDTNHSLNKKCSFKQKKDLPAWGLLCAIMDRLDDTVHYVNGLVLNTGKFNRSAFDFYNFINQSAVIIDCINELAYLFEVSLKELDEYHSIFRQLGKDELGSDKMYIEYLRSLCSVHPVKTSRHVRYQDNNDFESSPYVIWNENKNRYKKRGDLYAKVYTIKEKNYIKIIPIEINEVFDYIAFRYQFLNEIIDGVRAYNLNVTNNFISNIIKKEDKFENYTDYLEDLIIESRKRFGDNYSYGLEEAKTILLSPPTNNLNIIKHEKYCNAIKYAIKFEHNGLQNMTFDGYLNCGIKHQENNSVTSLLYEIVNADSDSSIRRMYRYNIEKISALSYSEDEYDIDCAYENIKSSSDLFDKYVSFEDANSNYENYLLVKIALYFECLDNNCILNKNIPNDIDFRNRLLTEDEEKDLIKEKKIDNIEEEINFIDDFKNSYIES